MKKVAAKRRAPAAAAGYGAKLTKEVERRLKAIEGHSAAIARMWDEGAPAPDFLQQIAAVRQAWDNVAKILLLADLELSVKRGVAEGSSDVVFAQLERTLARYMRLPTKAIKGAGRHGAGAGERHSHLHRHPDGTVHSHDHGHGDHWHPILGTLVEPPLHKH